MRTSKRVLLGAAIGAMIAMFSMPAHAAGTLTLYDGVNPLITVTDNGPGDFNPVTGSVLIVTNVGVWNLAISSGLTKPVTGSSTDPVMDVNLQANSTAAGSLRLVFSDNGFGPAAGVLQETISGHLTAGAPATASTDVYGDPANVVGATTVHIAGTGTLSFPIGPTTASGLLSLGAPFSLTEVEQIVASGPTFVNTDFSFEVVGELPVPDTGRTAILLAAAGGSLWFANRKLKPSQSRAG